MNIDRLLILRVFLQNNCIKLKDWWVKIIYCSRSEFAMRMLSILLIVIGIVGLMAVDSPASGTPPVTWYVPPVTIRPPVTVDGASLFVDPGAAFTQSFREAQQFKAQQRLQQVELEQAKIRLKLQQIQLKQAEAQLKQGEELP